MTESTPKYLPGTRTPDLTALTFGRLTVLEFVGRGKNGRALWRCKCECGGEAVSLASNLKRGNTTSCGCVRLARSVAASRTHGQKGTRLYERWKGMVQRVSNPNNPDYPRYGGRGITVCERWKSFENFAADMGPTFRDGLTLERVDVNANYTPENCTWITRAEQQRNRRDTVRVTFRGQTRPLAEWCQLLGLNRSTVWGRIKERGWPVERALTTGADPALIASLDDSGAPPTPAAS